MISPFSLSGPVPRICVSPAPETTGILPDLPAIRLAVPGALKSVPTGTQCNHSMLENWLAPTPQVHAVMPQILICLFALGMALAFVIADRESPTSRALAVGLAFIGITIDLNTVVPALWPVPAQLEGWFTISDGIAIIATLEWILRVRHTVPAGELKVLVGDLALRVGQGMAVVYVVLAILFPEAYANEFHEALSRSGALSKPGFWLFAVPIAFGAAAALSSIALLLNRKPDAPERRRVLSMAYAIPLMCVSWILPPGGASIAMTVGLIIVLIGGVQYHVMQGRRGQFVAQFLSPQVAELVNTRGLKAAMEEKQVELTALAIDLRGFTAYAEAHPTTRVVQVLREYYLAVGEEVARAGVTIKDINGDGILILVGAPLPITDHPGRALHLAGRLREVCAALTQRWSDEAHRLGVGIGIATGPVVVGAISAAARMEYTAVGSAINLASRLCEQASDGEILIAETTAAGLAPRPTQLEGRAKVALKGFAQPVVHFNLGTIAAATLSTANS